MNPLSPLFALVAWLMALLVALEESRTAPLGYEDEKGFHFDEPTP